MKKTASAIFWKAGVFSRLLLLLLSVFFTEGLQAQEFQSLFNGRDLDGWRGDTSFWSVRDGAIVGESTPERPCRKNTFLVWQGGEVADFELVCKARFVGNNSGVQYRSFLADPDTFSVKGYQADLHPKHEFFGMLYCEQAGRGIVARRFQRVEVGADSKIKVLSELGDKSQRWNGADWNELRIVAVGNRLIHQVNGATTVDVTDHHPTARDKGILALQLHAGAPMKVEFKDIQLRHLEGAQARERLQAVASSRPPKKLELLPFSGASQSTWVLNGVLPQWIWPKQGANKQSVFLRHSFDVAAGLSVAPVYLTCDNEADVWVNGELLCTIKDWEKPYRSNDIKRFLRPGKNHIAVRAKNYSGPAGLVMKMDLRYRDGRLQSVISDTHWKASLSLEEGWDAEGFDDRHWKQELSVLGELCAGPWLLPGLTDTSSHAPKVLAGFQIDEIFRFPEPQYGSKVSLTMDDKGRFLVCSQYDKRLHRITLQEEHKGLHIEKMPVKVGAAQGMVWHRDALYFHSPKGFFRVWDADGDDVLEAFEELPVGKSSSEHGNHAVVVAEDGEQLYVVAGNHTPLPPGETRGADRVQSWKEDFLLTREWDANGHARGIYAPGGWITRFDPDKKTHQVYSIGYRNQYDVALNRFGDLFTYDADMEYDMGMPWYRPTRINFVVSGSDYGWRSGTAKWPEYFEDSLPAVLNMGPGSPTGVVSGQGTKFPAKYQDAMYAFDWTFGTMHAIHLEPEGAGYRATSEVFCFGEPLPLTDGVVGRDGALYFITGGRRAASSLYRIRYVGGESTAPLDTAPEIPEAHQKRRALECYHGVVDSEALAAAWPYLASEDRWLRHAARVALESQPVNTWAGRVFSEPNPRARITAGMALARKGEKTLQPQLLKALLALDAATLTPSQQLGLLRAYALACIRMGEPDVALGKQVIAELDPLLPSGDDEVNAELIRMLVYLKAPSVIEKALALMSREREPELPDWNKDLISRNKRYGGPIQQMLAQYPPVQEINYAFMLRNFKEGWTLKQRRTYFEFLNKVASFKGGRSYAKFLENLRGNMLTSMGNAEREAVADVTGENFNEVVDFPIHPPKGPGQNWTVATALEHVTRPALRKADIKNGRSLYHAVACAACHRFGNLGGNAGPDLTMVRTKFDARYLLESIIEPSKQISDQYSSKMVTLVDGTVLGGIVVEREEQVDVYPMSHSTEELKPTTLTFDKIKSIQPSPVSQMPPMLINGMNGEEVRDLIAYLLSAGVPPAKKQHP